jgi:hypothetical protein
MAECGAETAARAGYGRPLWLYRSVKVCQWRDEGGASAPEMCAVFGWSKLETAEIYIREAQKRVIPDNAFTRLDEYRARKSVSVLGAKTGAKTKRGKNRD